MCGRRAGVRAADRMACPVRRLEGTKRGSFEGLDKVLRRRAGSKKRAHVPGGAARTILAGGLRTEHMPWL